MEVLLGHYRTFGSILDVTGNRGKVENSDR